MKVKNPQLLLFDIDGTLLSTHGVPRRAMERVLQKRFNNFTYDNEFNYSGRTDWEIVDHLLDFSGIEYPRHYSSLQTIFADFAYELEIEIKNGLKPHVYQGVFDLIKMLNDNSGFYLGLLTGNIAAVARLKLEEVGMYEYFPVGAFGDDAKERNKLADIAIQRAQDFFENKIDRKNIWIIGDSIYDVRCAKVNALRCLAVCTGLTSHAELEKENPEHVVDDFADVEQVINILNERS
jgi:phosphoglycolate phosphatase-like HAD superfamily hydrolase